MTNQTPHHPAPGRGFWSRRTPMQRVGILFAAALLPCCGGVTLIGVLADEPGRVQQVAPAADRQPAVADPVPTAVDPAPSAVPTTASPAASRTAEVSAPSPTANRPAGSW